MPTTCNAPHNEKPKVLLTGAAGFIGYHVANRLLELGEDVLGIDNLNPYYDPALKQARLARLDEYPGFRFARLDVANRSAMEAVFAEQEFSVVIHLAAQAGVRYSVDNPYACVEANLQGFLPVLEGVRRSGVRHLIYASSSSVYGDSATVPFSTTDRADSPVSLYAATKRANELMAHSYSSLFGFATTGLRFFTVYGPWGRPDMAPMKFAKAILAGAEIDIYNYGDMRRDFTYIDDIAEGVVRIARQPADAARPCRVFNVGNGAPVPLLEFVSTLERALGQAARQRLLPMQPGDVASTHADVTDFWQATGFRPNTPIQEGLPRFAKWYRDYYGAGAFVRENQRPGVLDFSTAKLPAVGSNSTKEDYEHRHHARA